MGPRVDTVRGNVLLAEGGAEVFQELAAIGRRERLFGPLRLFGLDAGQPFLRRHNRTAKASRFAVSIAERDDEVIELHDRAVFLIDHAAVVIGPPVASRAGQHNVSRFRIDENELNPREARQVPHHGIGIFALGNFRGNPSTSPCGHSGP